MSPSTAFPTVPGDLDRDRALRRCEYFTEVGLWPIVASGVDPEAWLDNFTPKEARHAAYLLNAFLYFNEVIIDQIFVAACASAARSSLTSSDRTQHPAEWRAFFENVVVTPVRGETPTPADSGALFARRARGLLGIPEARVLDQQPAIAHAAANGGDVLFVDDFVGTGNQFVKTFQRNVDVNGQLVSFASLAAQGTGRYFYAPVVATSRGISRIGQSCPMVRISAGHVLPERYSALHPDSLIWPDDLRSTAVDFVRDASSRAGIPNTPGTVDHWEGFGRLGLVVGFVHGTPDATLPLIWWDQNGWTPLRGRE